MCGIVGIIGQEIQNKEKTIGQMVEKIFHRGPDDDGFFVDGSVALGMRRLAIIDLNTGRQPITTDDGKLIIFFNGEIYNYKELIPELVVKGYKFKTHSDTEVILLMFQEYGEKMLPMLRGMFVFCIYNIETKEVFLARDFFGIKPLYYLVDPSSAEALLPQNNIVAFSSEIKSFLSFPGFIPEVNDKAIINYLSFQYNPLEESFFKNVYKLPPAHFLKINAKTGETEIKKYWSFEFNQNENLDEEVVSRTVLDTVKDSVEHHMIADVPVGAFLYGGIDSSIITALMQEVRKNPVQGETLYRIKTFTVGFDTLTEGMESKETSDFLDTDHTEIKIGQDEYFKELSKAVYHFDEPIGDPSAIGLYFIAREARKHVKVVLSGEGADELFGGYNIYLAPFASARLKWIPKWILNTIVRTFDSLDLNFWGTNYLRRVNMKLEDWYFGQKYFNDSVFQRKEIEKLCLPMGDLPKGEKYMSKIYFGTSSLYKKGVDLSESTQMQYVDINTWLVGDILAKADKMTMAHSLELRVPFLDTKVAKLAASLPDGLKWRNGMTKYLLREAFKKIIPESTRNRKKLGFPVPIREWLTKDREDAYKTILENDYIKTHMDTNYIQNLIDQHTSKFEDNSRKIYLLLMLALWYNVFIKDAMPQ